MWISSLQASVFSSVKWGESYRPHENSGAICLSTGPRVSIYWRASYYYDLTHDLGLFSPIRAGVGYYVEVRGEQSMWVLKNSESLYVSEGGSFCLSLWGQIANLLRWDDGGQGQDRTIGSSHRGGGIGFSSPHRHLHSTILGVWCHSGFRFPLL